MDYPTDQRTMDVVSTQLYAAAAAAVVVAALAADSLGMGCRRLPSKDCDMDCCNDYDKDCNMLEWAVPIVAPPILVEPILRIVYYDEAIGHDRQLLHSNNPKPFWIGQELTLHTNTLKHFFYTVFFCTGSSKSTTIT